MPGEGGGLVSGGIEVVNQLDTRASSSSHCTCSMVGCGNLGYIIGCDELTLRHAISITELAEHIVNHILPSEHIFEVIASQRVVECLENAEGCRIELLLQPLYFEVTNVDDGVAVIYVNQLDTYDRRFVDGSLVVGRSVGQFRGQRPGTVRIVYAGELLLVCTSRSWCSYIRLGRHCETELETGGFQCLFGDFLGGSSFDIAAGNHRQQVNRFIVCLGE